MFRLFMLLAASPPRGLQGHLRRRRVDFDYLFIILHLKRKSKKIPSSKIVINLPRTLRSYPVKENHISLVVSKILRYKQACVPRGLQGHMQIGKLYSIPFYFIFYLVPFLHTRKAYFSYTTTYLITQMVLSYFYALTVHAQ